MDDTLAACKRVSVLLRDGLVYYVALVAGEDHWGVLPDLLDQLAVPGCGALERVCISHVVDEESAGGALVVVLGKCVILFLTSRIPDGHLNALRSYLDYFFQE